MTDAGATATVPSGNLISCYLWNQGLFLLEQHRWQSKQRHMSKKRRVCYHLEQKVRVEGDFMDINEHQEPNHFPDILQFFVLFE